MHSKLAGETLSVRLDTPGSWSVVPILNVQVQGKHSHRHCLRTGANGIVAVVK